MRHDIPATQERPAGAAGDTGAQRYAPIGRHAVIGDRRTAALVTDDGTIDWWCLPNFDGQPVLAGLLDVDQGGRWRLGPEARVAGAQQYIDHSAVVRTCWSQPASGLELTDCMLWPDRPAGDPREHRRVILRQLRCTSGRVRCTTQLAVGSAFGAPWPVRPAQAIQASEPSDSSEDILTLWVSDAAVQADLLAHGQAGFELAAGQAVWMLLGPGEHDAAWDPALAEEALEQTLAAWRGWAETHPYYGPRQESMLASVRAIRLLAFEPAGSQVAAPTT